jgi:tRNA/rRNA methyltransferase
MPVTPEIIPPCFILVRPQMGENIGAAARAMLNFGLERLRVVDPRDGWPNSKAVAMASGAGRLLDHAGPYPTVQAAIADCDYVFATTARGRELVKPVVTPERAMEMTRAMVAEGKRRAVRARAGGAGERGCGAGQCHRHRAGEPGVPLSQPCAMRLADGL